jgi:hypothetical protein
METKLKFVEGIRVYGPGKNTPSFVKANLNFNSNELMVWLNSQPENFVVDIKESKNGKYYMAVSEFTPKAKPEYVPDMPVDEPTDGLPF